MNGTFSRKIGKCVHSNMEAWTTLAHWGQLYLGSTYVSQSDVAHS